MTIIDMALGGLVKTGGAGGASCCEFTPDPCATKFEAVKMKGLGTVNRRIDTCCDCQLAEKLACQGITAGDVWTLMQIPNDVMVLGWRVKVVKPIPGLILQFKTPQSSLGAAVDMSVDGFTHAEMIPAGSAMTRPTTYATPTTASVLGSRCHSNVETEECDMKDTPKSPCTSAVNHLT